MHERALCRDRGGRRPHLDETLVPARAGPSRTEWGWPQCRPPVIAGGRRMLEPEVTVELPLAPMAGAMQFAREHLAATDNLGRTGDEADVYAVIEELAGGVRATYPGSKCGAGCSACCALHKALFRIYRSEWDTVHDYILETWDASRLAAFVRHFWDTAGPHLPFLEQIQARMDQGWRMRPEFEELPVDCPFLEDRRCAVYPARAAICRGFGYFHLRPDGGGDLEIYACNMQRAVLRETPASEPRAGLPVFNTVYRQVENICEGEPKRLIPLWIARTFPRQE